MTLGLSLHRPRLAPVIGQVIAGSVAEAAGLQAGDRVLAIAGQPVDDWAAVSGAIRQSPGVALRLGLSRGDDALEVTVVPTAEQDRGRPIGRIGIAVKDPGAAAQALSITMRYGPGPALVKAVAMTWDMAALSLEMIGRMIVGQVSWKNVSGPVTIADYAGQSASLGMAAYIRFIALISISLGVLNLLPIPVLDGGHLMYHFAEIIKGGPLSERAMEIGQQIGLALLGLLMIFALYNDVTRLISG
jgi:regulator of sigma E protease